MSQQRKLICASNATANRLAAKIVKHRRGRVFEVHRVSRGWQVVEIRKFAGCGLVWDGLSWTRRPTRSTAAICQPVRVSAPAAVTTVSLPFHLESPAYIGAVVDGRIAWFGKSTLISFAIADGTVAMTLPAKLALKRGFAA